MALPFLPGYSTNTTLGKDSFNKGHAFDMRNGVPVEVGVDKPAKTVIVPNGAGQPAPSWVAFDRQVLRFSAYFQEAVHEKREETYRIRRCTILYYLEDDSIQVNEARQENSGIPQGTLIRRHRIPKPAPNDDSCYTVDAFNVGNSVTLYGRIFTITDCDAFSRNYLTKTGTKVPEPAGGEPVDPYFEHRRKQADAMQPHRPYEKCDTLKQFLDNDRKVLRFYCVWDHSSEMFGDVRELILHYFLADDTMEIREVIKANSGRDAAPKFLHRSKVPKEVGALHKPGEITQRTVLNVFGPMGHGGRYILDSLKTGAVEKEFYTDADLSIGSKVNVWGREVTICGMDEFTEHHYKCKFNVDMPTPIVYKTGEAARVEREIPPYNGWGSEEDSRANCLKLIAQAPKRDFIKFMKKDRQGLESHVLRYLARMDTNRPIDIDRTFIISFFLSDGTISVFEPEKRNSGIVHGKFIERSRINKKEGGYYEAEDLFVGALVTFRSHQFIITDADEYAKTYAENHKFPEADFDRIMEVLAGSISGEQLEKEFMDRATVDIEPFMEFLEMSTRGQLSQHAMMVVARAYGVPLHPKVTYDLVLKLSKEQLSKVVFDRYDELLVALNQALEEGDGGLLEPSEVYRVCTAVKLPLKRDLLTSLIQQIPKTDGRVNCEELVASLKSKEGTEENVNFIPASKFAQPDKTASGWYGLKETTCNTGPIQSVIMSGFKEDLARIRHEISMRTP